MKLQNGDSILTGVAEVSVDKIIALEKSVTDKDQTIGALQQQIKGLETKIEEVKAEAIAKQAMVIIQKGSPQKEKGYIYCKHCNYHYDSRYYGTCPSCGNMNNTLSTEEVKEYKNLDTVIDGIRKEEAKKLGIELNEFENKIGVLELEKTKLVNSLNLKVKELEETLKTERKEKESDIASAKEKIRKHMTSLIDPLNDEIEELNEELKKVKKDKTDEAVEDARKKEIIDLKERIHELEVSTLEKPEFGWFKMLFYNWLKVDARAKIQAQREVIEKQNRINKISKEYPKNKNWWAPEWLFASADPWNW